MNERDMTLEEAARLVDMYINLLGEKAKFRIQVGNGYDRPEFEVGKDDGVKFVYVC